MTARTTHHTAAFPTLSPHPHPSCSNRIFKQSASSADIDSHIKDVESQGGKVKQRFDSEIMKGFAATMPQDHAQALTAKSGGEHM